MTREIVAHILVEAENDETPEVSRQKVISLISNSRTAKQKGITLTEVIYKAPTVAKVVSVIPAEVHTDDYFYAAEFDALPWFLQATTSQIIDLASIDWGGDQASDYVAMFFEDTNGEIEGLFHYLDKVKNKDIGFECHIDKTAALSWLKDQKPKIYELLESEGLLDEEE